MSRYWPSSFRRSFNVRNATSTLAATAFALTLLLTSSPASAVPSQTAPSASPSPERSYDSEPDIQTRSQWAAEFLRLGGWPVTGQNICAVVGWEHAEGGHFIQGSTTFNPLNTSQSMPGATVFNSHGVKNYPNWSTGLVASVKTLDLGFYSQIRAALEAGTNAGAVLGAVVASPWGTKSDNPSSFIPGGCLANAQAFDTKREVVEAQISKDEAALALNKANLVKAQTALEKTEARYDSNAPKVRKAKEELNRLARQLYMISADPELLALAEGVSSNDPVAFAVINDYVSRASGHDGIRVQQAIEYLARVHAKIGRSKAKVDELQVAIAADEQAIADSNTELRNLASLLLGDTA